MDRPFKVQGYEVCRLLRWKSMFIEAESDPTVPPSNDGAYWCATTQVCIGPDGQVAAPEGCSPERSCYDKLTLIQFT
jgi:hypothetical protein